MIVLAYEICRICGRFFEKNGRRCCNSCYQKDKEEYSLVREYVLRHKGANAMEVSSNTEIPLKTIYRYIDEGRIDIDKKTNIKDEGWRNGS